MKKRSSPCTPLRVKAKGKEIPDGDGLDIIHDPLRPRGRAHTRRSVRKAAMVKRWLETIFANGIEDPIPLSVSEAIRLFGCEKDRLIWTWYANRVGVNTFLNFMFEVDACFRAGELRNPAGAFQKRLKDVLPKQPDAASRSAFSDATRCTEERSSEGTFGEAEPEGRASVCAPKSRANGGVA